LPRRDLLDISPVLTEAAGAIVDVSASRISAVLVACELPLLVMAILMDTSLSLNAVVQFFNLLPSSFSGPA